ncbi:alpha/beta hydrolase [Streptomyces sp. NBC_00576]|uniref:alpha/beta hydrolase n=1 Tax=Streptomyces sp. NBC_00576 TaxID=2903665 RepID=UPI002E801107|nr:alpha/beta fold hydrolase [Streptomyces sp. NBC_00576]WUB74882.1 alpha/beta fold hydrolase [Streptomyces sp. NBC_00576]
MAELLSTRSPGVRGITLDADGIPISCLLAEPRTMPPRAVVVAVHGGGTRAGYFDSRVQPGLSLLALGAQLGYTVLAVDRPGYGASSVLLPEGQTLAEQTTTLHAALADFARGNQLGAGFFLVAHSNGGKLALGAASDHHGRALLGLDISGLGHRFAVEVPQLPCAESRGDWRRHWGAPRFYPPGAFQLARSLLAPVPGLEGKEGPLWPQLWPGIAARVRTPVRFTFAEQEQWWRHDDEAVAELTDLLATPKVTVARQPDAGHNISLGWAARTYHLRALAFLEECLLAREAVINNGVT